MNIQLDCSVACIVSMQMCGLCLASIFCIFVRKTHLVLIVTSYYIMVGPLPRTVVDFWRMVWQERPSAIVMFTNCKEGGRVKCEQYWPETGSKKYGPFSVVRSDKEILADYTIRKLQVKVSFAGESLSLISIVLQITAGSESHSLIHFHFTSWPDHGVPAYASPVLSFQRLIRSHHVPSSGPLVVHCRYVLESFSYLCKSSFFSQCWSWSYWYLHHSGQCVGSN